VLGSRGGQGGRVCGVRGGVGESRADDVMRVGIPSGERG
jgi:hypothetical protein